MNHSDATTEPSRRPRSVSDGVADSLASVAIMAIVTVTFIFWLSGR